MPGYTNVVLVKIYENFLMNLATNIWFWSAVSTCNCQTVFFFCSFFFFCFISEIQAFVGFYSVFIYDSKIVDKKKESVPVAMTAAFVFSVVFNQILKFCLLFFLCWFMPASTLYANVVHVVYIFDSNQGKIRPKRRRRIIISLCG